MATKTLKLSTAAASEDASLLSGTNANNNYGDWVAWHIGQYSAASARKTLIRVATAYIPTGTIIAARLYILRKSHANSTQSGTVEAYAVKDANAWVAGTAYNTPQTGSVCWANLAYHATTPTAWAGSAGCSTSGTDYDADASPPSLAFTAYTTGADVLMSAISLPAAWFSAWKNGSRVNNGFLLAGKAGDPTGALIISNGNASGSYLEIDYAGGGRSIRSLRRDIRTLIG